MNKEILSKMMTGLADTMPEDMLLNEFENAIAERRSKLLIQETLGEDKGKSKAEDKSISNLVFNMDMLSRKYLIGEMGIKNAEAALDKARKGTQLLDTDGKDN